MWTDNLPSRLSMLLIGGIATSLYFHPLSSWAPSESTSPGTHTTPALTEKAIFQKSLMDDDASRGSPLSMLNTSDGRVSPSHNNCNPKTALLLRLTATDLTRRELAYHSNLTDRESSQVKWARELFKVSQNCRSQPGKREEKLTVDQQNIEVDPIRQFGIEGSKHRIEYRSKFSSFLQSTYLSCTGLNCSVKKHDRNGCTRFSRLWRDNEAALMACHRD